MPSIALAIMAKSPRLGRPKTRLQPPLSASEAEALAVAFLQDTARLALASQARPYIACTPPEGLDDILALTGWPATRVFPQQGDGLSERCQAAFDFLFSQGAQAALLIGADTPHLPSGRLNRAVDLLVSPQAAHRLVLGPSRDGGYYLIGLRQESREALPRLLEGMRWSTSTVLADTMTRAAAAGLEAVLLPLCDDVDLPADLHRLALHLAQTPEALLPAAATRRILPALSHRLASGPANPLPSLS